ncbi:MAG: glycosyltransferase [Acidimicrobiia bacterium]|nr:glycosyltransferase [Acidimicrobiia bacterium]
MRVLLIHNRYALRGGEDESTDAERALLESNGHAVEMLEVSNEGLSDTLEVRRATAALGMGVRSIWSRQAGRAVDDHIARFQPDIVHVQNTFPKLSPAVHYAAQRNGVPVVQTLRNYRLICPKASFFRDGAPCEDCLGKLVPTPSVRHGCYRDSRATTVWVAAGQAIHTALGTWRSEVDLFISPSEFTRHKYIESGLIPADRIVVKPNFLADDPGPGTGEGDYFLFVGRLSEEKGIATLLAAWSQVPHTERLEIIGNGPLNSEVEAFAARHPGVTWQGRVSNDEAVRAMGRAKALIFPSVWYETFGRVAMEAFATGTPVIGSDLGAVAEVVAGSDAGMLFEPGNASELAKAINWAVGERGAMRDMRRAARATYEDKYTAAGNYDQLLAAYELARERHAAG